MDGILVFSCNSLQVGYSWMEYLGYITIWELSRHPIYKATCNVILKHFVSPIHVSPTDSKLITQYPG